MIFCMLVLPIKASKQFYVVKKNLSDQRAVERSLTYFCKQYKQTKVLQLNSLLFDSLSFTTLESVSKNSLSY